MRLCFSFWPWALLPFLPVVCGRWGCGQQGKRSIIYLQAILSALSFRGPCFLRCRHVWHSRSSAGCPSLSVQLCPPPHIPSPTPLNPHSPLPMSRPRALGPSLYSQCLKLRGPLSLRSDAASSVRSALLPQLGAHLFPDRSL